jgi:hypothetical protein
MAGVKKAKTDNLTQDILLFGLAGIAVLPVKRNGQRGLGEPLLVPFQILQFHLGKEFIPVWSRSPQRLEQSSTR